ncbi:unnamed protein product [Caenorhabditis sp. 36 PRJEB53466]|nr:unnamed protein product [Caenorhabditis sp. 36 PRJEB53466]
MTSKPEEARNKEIDSSEEEEGYLQKLLKKEQFKLQDEFRLDVEGTIKYLQALNKLTDSLQKVVVSGTSYHFDEKRQVPYSGWRYLTGYLKKVDWIGKNKTEAENFISACDLLGFAEEKKIAVIRNPDERSNIFMAGGPYRQKMEQLNAAMGESIKRCNRRRKKVEKAAVMKDLKDQGPKYVAAVKQLDTECREMENYTINVSNHREYHHLHIRKSLGVIEELSEEKTTVLKDKLKKKAIGEIKPKNSTTPKKEKGEKSVMERTIRKK